jgi:hypothetical protein
LSPSGQDAFLHQRDPIEIGFMPLRSTNAPSGGWQMIRENASRMMISTDDTPRTVLTLDIDDSDNFLRAIMKYPDTNKVIALTERHTKEIKEYCNAAIRRHLEQRLNVPAYIIQQINNNNFYINTSAADKRQSDFIELRQIIMDIGKDERLKKKDGYIYRPIKPCAYVRAETYEDFISKSLRGNPVFNSNVRNFDSLLKFLTNYDESDFANLQVDSRLISFDNGVFRITDCSFFPYDSLPDLNGAVARSHIPSVFLGLSDTPLFDSIVRYQLRADDAYRWFLVCLGRLFFRVGELDNWEVTMIIQGNGGTGKSSIIDILIACLGADRVACLTSNMENVFGLQDKYDRDLLVAPDYPIDTASMLAPTIWQSMTTGEIVQIPRKQKSALSIKWSAPMLWMGNHPLGYPDNGGAISRRAMVHKFVQHVEPSMVDCSLKRRIIDSELPAIVFKCISEYLQCVEARRGHSVWTFCSQHCKDNRDEVMAETDFLYRFLIAPPDENTYADTRYYCVYQKDALTEIERVRDLYMKWMKYKHPSIKRPWTNDRSAFQRLGYDIVTLNLCKACSQKHVKGCCSRYNRANKTQKIVTNIKNEILQYKNEGYTCIGFGAAAKAQTFHGQKRRH